MAARPGEEHSDEGSTEGSARAVAFDRLVRIEEEGTFIGIGRSGLDSGGRRQRQTLEYVAGITRWRRRLDFIIAHYYKGPYEDMELGLKVALRIGLYDLLFLDTPPYAAVNEAVELASRRIRRGAGGLVNGVLRSVQRNRDDLPRPHSEDEADDLGVLHSHPTWMVRRWIERYGSEGAEALLRWNNARPVYGVRINTLKIDETAFLHRLDDLAADWTPSSYLAHFLRMGSVQPLLEHGLLQDGSCAVQDESAGLIVHLLDPQPGERMIDLCAAPGGKALYSAQRMRGEGSIAAVDVHRGRLRLVERAARAQGVRIVRAVHADARQLDGTWRAAADRVLIDAPCSGLGVLSKRADLRWRRKPEDLADLSALQDELLDAAAGLVRKGGMVVYGTCTIEPEENEERVEAFLARQASFRLVDAGERLPSRLVTRKGCYAAFPPRDAIDGAFAACFRRVA